MNLNDWKETDVAFIRLKTNEALLCRVVEWRVPGKESFAGTMSMRIEHVGTMRAIANPQDPGKVGYSVIAWMSEVVDIPLREIMAVGKANDHGADYHTELFSAIARPTPKQTSRILAK